MSMKVQITFITKSECHCLKKTMFELDSQSAAIGLSLFSFFFQIKYREIRIRNKTIINRQGNSLKNILIQEAKEKQKNNHYSSDNLAKF